MNIKNIAFFSLVLMVAQVRSADEQIDALLRQAAQSNANLAPDWQFRDELGRVWNTKSLRGETLQQFKQGRAQSYGSTAPIVALLHGANAGKLYERLSNPNNFAIYFGNEEATEDNWEELKARATNEGADAQFDIIEIQ